MDSENKLTSKMNYKIVEPANCKKILDQLDYVFKSQIRVKTCKKHETTM